MKREIEVCIGAAGVEVASLHFNAEGNRENSGFDYKAAWLNNGFAIEPNLPLVAGPTFTAKKRDQSTFPGAIADSEPDGWAKRVIARDHAKRRQNAQERGEKIDGKPLNSLDYLLLVDDYARIGALRFRDEKKIFQRTTEPGRRTAPPLLELGELLRASRAVEDNSESADDLRYLQGRGTSIGGLRPKCSVRDKEKLYIAKFPSLADTHAVTKGEVLALKLAASAGIKAAEARIIDVNGSAVSLIARFDRTIDGKRIPYISAATLLGVKDRSEERAYTDIVDGLNPNAADYKADCEELWRRIAFNILITNIDDHLANTGFLHVEKGKWRISPAFDLNPFPDKGRTLKTWISNTAGEAASIEALMDATEYFQLQPARARQVIGEVEIAVQGWRKTGRATGMSERELDEFAPAFEHTEREAARRHAV
jgi:serine/threonine-protein kinase HipA